MDHSHILPARYGRFIRLSLSARPPFQTQTFTEVMNALHSRLADGLITILVETLQWLLPHS